MNFVLGWRFLFLLVEYIYFLVMFIILLLNFGVILNGDNVFLVNIGKKFMWLYNGV